MVLRKSSKRKKEFPVGLVLFLIVTLIFMGRFIKIALQRDVKGGLAYIQLINAGMPLIEGTYYDEEAYEESSLTISSIVIETLGVDKINPENILAYELPGFNEYNMLADNETNAKDDIDSFVLDNTSIDKSEKPSNIKVEGVRNPNIVQTLDQSKPRVLIYSTHTDEGYSQPRDFSPDSDKNVIGVGELIAKELEEYYGISTIHDKTNHSTFYQESYYRSRETVQKYADKYGSFDMVIDLHRDGIGTNANKSIVTTELNGEALSKIMFVDTRNSENFESTHAMNQRMYKKSQEIFPGFTRGIRTANRGKAKYNQHILSNTTLIEVGAEKSTPQEAQNSAKYIARLIAEELYARQNGETQ